MADALNEGCDSIVTCGGIQSNHARATAVAAAELGLKSHLVLRWRGTIVSSSIQSRESSNRQSFIIISLVPRPVSACFHRFTTFSQFFV